MVRKLLVGSIAAATAMMSYTAGAQQPGAQAVEEIIVTSTTRRAESLGDINASVAVLSEEELRQIAHTHYQEALARLPGVNISRNNGQESLIAIRSPVLTGPGACGSFLTAEQGIPLRAAGFCNVNEMFDSNTENAERIEVIRGPATAFYGSNALHGMINTVLPDPEERLDVTLEAGPWGSYRAGVVAGFDSGNFKHMFLATGENSEGWQDDSGVDQQKLSWLYQYQTAGGYQLDGGFTRTNLNQETGGYVVGTDAYKDSSLRDTNPNPEAYRDNASFRIWTRVSRELDNDWEVVFTPYFREVNLNFIQHFLPGDPTEDSEHRSLGFQFASYKDFSDNSFLALGLDMESTDGNLFQFQENPTQGSAFLRNTIPQGAHYDYEVEAFQIAPFIHYQYYVSEQLDLSLGLRWERMDYEYDNLMLDGRTKDNGEACGFGGCRYSRPADRDDDFDNVSPKLGVRYRFSDQYNVQARIQRGFRAPQATEMYRLQGANPDIQVARLDSVELDSFELAFEGIGDGWEYSITGYYMEKENEIGTDSSRAKVTDNETEHKGIELAGALTLTDNLTLLGTYNIADHTYEKDFITGEAVEGNDVDTAPNNFGNFRLNWQITPAVSTELEWVNMGEYYTNPENTADYDGHDIFNLRTNWAVNEDLNVSLRILNLTDEEYAERADWTTFGGDRYFIGQPLRAFLSFTYSLR
jgi:outer membrane receptor protein involved in Fe transport